MPIHQCFREEIGASTENWYFYIHNLIILPISILFILNYSELLLPFHKGVIIGFALDSYTVEEDAKNIILTVSILRGSLTEGRNVMVRVMTVNNTAEGKNLITPGRW